MIEIFNLILIYILFQMKEIFYDFSAPFVLKKYLFESCLPFDQNLEDLCYKVAFNKKPGI